MAERDIPYMVIGGQAVLVYGEARLTQDIDITLGVDLTALQDILDAVSAAGLRPLVDPQSFTRQTMVLPCQDIETDIRVDLVFTFSPYERHAISRTKAVSMAGVDIRFVSLEDLIIFKVVAGRPRDMADVRGLLIRNSAVDAAYIRGWLREFGEALDQPLSERFEDIRRDVQHS